MANPTAAEQQQELLELMNRMRLRPASELEILLKSARPNDPSYDLYTEKSIKDFEVDTTAAGGLSTQWKDLKPVAALAWSGQLTQAAKNHNDLMIQYNQQEHRVKVSDNNGTPIYEKDLESRLADVGYLASGSGENLYAYGHSVRHTHASFAIDWGDEKGVANDGIQRTIRPDVSIFLAGHRQTMMSASLREVGISVSTAFPATPKDVGPFVVTQNFGNRAALEQKTYVLGVAFQDQNGDGWYTAGEGFKQGKIQVKITGINGTNFISKLLDVSDTGSYQELLDSGEYQVDFVLKDNGSLVGSQNIFVNADKPDNIKVDLISDNSNKFQTNLVLPVVKLGSNVQTGGLESKVIDFRVDNTGSKPENLSNKKIDANFIGVTADAKFHNYAGLYRVEDNRGTVIDPIDNKSYQPGDSGYIAAALRASKNIGVEIDRNGKADSFNLTGGSLYAPFVVADGRVDDVLNSKNSATTPRVYFNYIKANVDNTEHIKLLGANKFGFEDVFGGGDRDYNDLIFQVDAKVSIANI
jgi:Domain of unknown function (DUF4114)/Cysteine-rich secretory protein family